ncbi:glycoside hydrolase family 28 protein [Pedobacter sp. SD-b]|uniref:Glycoside hydrolase family 28 protein n=1 Tax=Pedobacter segetis TaxID=2793069 RepID=A0ABS1BJN3_9SPHI|nr:glycoside hydrolase family 28 protein [Pedobacter segetis]MBK0383090.1 glycoside hydrolase family 28 protein [Pedobacter segetis]
MRIFKILFLGIIIQACLQSCSANTISKINPDQSGITDSLEFTNYFKVKMPIIKTPVFKKDTFDISKSGAKGDGIFLNTQIINATITACSNKGGGVVLIPGGIWLTGPIYMKSNVNLHIKRDAILQFTKDKNQYKLVEGNWEGKPSVRNESPISGNNLENIAISGTGIIDGNGDVWRAVKKDKLTESQWKNLVKSGGLVGEDKKTWYPSKSYLKGDQTKDASVIQEGKSLADYQDMKDFFRPNLLVLTKCKTVLLEGVTFQNSPAWCLHPLMCEDLTLKGVYAKNPFYAQNGDGVDVESCKNVMIENSTFDVGDDGICIKSGRDEDGRKRGMPTENLIARNNVVYHAHGGFVIGSEMSGGAKNLFVYNNSFIGTDIGLRFKTTRGRGGVVEKIYISDINMKDIAGEAIRFDMYYAAKDPVPLADEVREAPKVELFPVTDETPQFKDFHIRNINCDGAAKAIFMRGLPEMNIHDIYLENLTIQAKEGVELTEASNISIKNLNLMVGNSNPLINVDNSKNISFEGLKSFTDVGFLMNISGVKTTGVKISNSSISTSKDKITYTLGASSKALTIK